MTDSQPEEVEPEDDGFDDIVNQTGDAPLAFEMDNMWGVIKQAYPHLYDGILVRGILIIDRVDGDGDREMFWVPSDPETPAWENQGLAQQIVDDLQAENSYLISRAMDNVVRKVIKDLDEDEEDEDEQ